MQRGGPLDRQRQAADLHRRQHRPESWDNNGPERPRIEMQERWYNYICEEFVPRLLEINREQSEDHTGCILTGGASMGGGHAVNFYLRRPDIFNGTIA